MTLSKINCCSIGHGCFEHEEHFHLDKGYVSVLASPQKVHAWLVDNLKVHDMLSESVHIPNGVT